MVIRNLIVVILVLVGACDQKLVQQVTAPLDDNHSYLLLAGRTGKTGMLEAIDLGDGKRIQPRVVTERSIPIHSDAMMRLSPDGEKIFVVNRLGRDSIQVISRDFSIVLNEYSVGRATNPQDISLHADGTAHISRYRSTKLLKVNALTGEKIAETGLEVYNDSDGFPEMSYMKTWGDDLLVQVQRIQTDKKYIPEGTSYLANVNKVSSSLSRVDYKLAIPNPFTDFKKYGKGFCIGEGRLEEKVTLDGGIECWDEHLNSQKLIVTEKELGGDILDFEFLSKDKLVVIVSNQGTHVVVFDMTTRKSVLLLTSKGYAFTQIIQNPSRPEFFVTDKRAENPGIHFFSFDKGKILKEDFVRLKLDPQWMVYLPVKY